MVRIRSIIPRTTFLSHQIQKQVVGGYCLSTIILFVFFKEILAADVVGISKCKEDIFCSIKHALAHRQLITRGISVHFCIKHRSLIKA